MNSEKYVNHHPNFNRFREICQANKARHFIVSLFVFSSRFGIYKFTVSYTKNYDYLRFLLLNILFQQYTIYYKREFGKRFRVLEKDVSP